MELQLKNIGMIKEANVKLNGLTVIAGENDTGKSTVGKAFYLQLQSMKEMLNKNKEYFNDNKYPFAFIDDLTFYLFKRQISNEYGNIRLQIDNFIWENRFYNHYINGVSIFDNDKQKYVDLWNLSLEPCIPIMVETPLVWNFTDFFRDIAQIESQMRIELDYPYLMKDLNFKLHIKSALSGFDIKDRVTSLIGGEFKKDEMGRYYFDKHDERIELVNTATGIKTFGIFQILSQNHYLNENTTLVLDEPEVHLHPKWQLEMAELIVFLVKNGVKILVNSHSPYMIEALERYGEKEGISQDFYLAEDGFIHKINDNNSVTLSRIFEKLSAPYQTFDEMDSEILRGG